MFASIRELYIEPTFVPVVIPYWIDDGFKTKRAAKKALVDWAKQYGVPLVWVSDDDVGLSYAELLAKTKEAS